MYLVQTVQTSSPWRSHPGGVTSSVKMEEIVSNGATKSRKWSLGGFFRRKKKDMMESESSSEEDRKAGFSPKRRNKDKKKRSSKLIAFDHIVVPPNRSSVELPQQAGSLDRRFKGGGRRKETSSDENLSHNSLQSSGICRFRSDDSLTNQSTGSTGNRKSRSARTERYLKRRSRDEEGSSPNQTIYGGRWKTQPISYSSQSIDGQSVQPMRFLSNGLVAKPTDRRSFSYDTVNRISPEAHVKSPPPLPPPRDPQRRLNVYVESRPISYAFDRQGGPGWTEMGERCVSDNRLNVPETCPRRPASVQPPEPRRFITRRPNDKNNNMEAISGGGGAYKYLTDAAPRSRKPIQMVSEPFFAGTRNERSNTQSATDFWRRIDEDVSRRGGGGEPQLVRPKVLKPKYRYDVPVPQIVDFLEENRVASLPSYCGGNKYEEHVAKNCSRKPQMTATVVTQSFRRVPPEPPARISSAGAAGRKSANLEEAINELEEIYKSLKLGDESLMDRAERRDIPTPDFSKIHPADYEDEEEECSGEPDIIKDDVAYRNLRHANSMPKVIEPLPFGIPMGPIPPSPGTDYLKFDPPGEKKSPKKSPDIVSDDLAYRSLRKDSSNGKKQEHFVVPNTKRATRTMSANIYNLIQRDAAKPSGGRIEDYLALDKPAIRLPEVADEDVPSTVFVLRKPVPCKATYKNGAVFNLPSTLNSLSPASKPPIPTVRKSVSPDVRKLKDTEMEDALNALAREAKITSEKLGRDLMVLRKEAKGSDVPETRGSINREKKEEDIEEVSRAARLCEEILKGVVKDVKKLESPEKVMQSSRLLHEIGEASRAVKACEKMLKDVVQDTPKKMLKDEKLIRDINEVSLAVAGCEKILKEVVKTETPKVEVKSAKSEVKSPKSEVKSPKVEVMNSKVESMMEKLQTETRLNAVTEKCMEQLKILKEEDAQGPDYDNLRPEVQQEVKEVPKMKEKDRKMEDDIDRMMKECSESVPEAVEKPSSTTFSDLTKLIRETASEEAKVEESADQVDSDKTPYSSPIEEFVEERKTPHFVETTVESPSPPLELTPPCMDDESQYNSSEELAMIFGISQTSLNQEETSATTGNSSVRRRFETIHESPDETAEDSRPRGLMKKPCDAARGKNCQGSLIAPQHIIVACTFGLANYDVITYLAILAAIVLLIAFIVI